MKSHLTGVSVRLPGAHHGVQHVPVQLLVVGHALLLLPHPHVHLLQGGARGPAEIYRAPTFTEDQYRRCCLLKHFLTYDESPGVGEVSAVVWQTDGPDGVGEGGGPVQPHDGDVVLVRHLVVVLVELHGRHGEGLVPRLPGLVEVVLPELDPDVLLPKGGEAVRRGQNMVIPDQSGAAILSWQQTIKISFH